MIILENIINYIAQNLKLLDTLTENTYMNTSVVALKMNLVHDGFFFLKTSHRTAVRINAAGKHVSEDCRLFEVYAHAPVLYTIRVCYVFNNNPLP